MHNPRWQAVAALIASTVLFASSYTLTKIALVDLGPLSLGMIRFVLTGGLLVGWAVVTRQPLPGKADRKRLVWGGLLGVTGYFAVENTGLQWASATDAALIVAAYPAITALADAAINRRRTSALAWAGIGLAILGVAGIVLAVPVAAGGSPLRLWGDLLLLVPGLLWALYTFATREVSTSAVLTIAWQDAVGGLAFIPLALIELPGWRMPSQPQVTGVAVLGLTVLCSIAAMIAYARALQDLPTPTVVTGLNLVPLWGLLIAAVALGEPILPLQVLAGVVVCVGVTLTARGSARAPLEAEPVRAARPDHGAKEAE